MKKLTEMTLRELVDLHNSLLAEGAKPARATSFRNKEAAVEAVRALQRARGRKSRPGATSPRGEVAGPGTVRSLAEELLMTPRAYSEILEEVRKRFPDCRTSRSSLRWYASQMRGRGERLPPRPVDSGRG